VGLAHSSFENHYRDILKTPTDKDKDPESISRSVNELLASGDWIYARTSGEVRTRDNRI